MKVITQHIADRFAAYQADTVEFTAQMPASSVDLSVYSPPFSSLYIYSESERDMGNVASDDEFQATYRHLVRELFRITKPGRLTCIHVKDLVYYSNSSERGDRGLRDFTGSCIRTHLAEGWTLHRKVTVDRCPVREMQKTKADRLLYKHFRTDGARSGGGMPEYIVVFRKWADGMDDTAPIVHDRQKFPLESWQALAQPIWQSADCWYGTRETGVLNIGAKSDEERHLCPMPLDLIERCVLQYSNPDETVYSPFMGIGSEGYVSLLQGRRFIGTELSAKYFSAAVRHLKLAEQEGVSGSLLDQNFA